MPVPTDLLNEDIRDLRESNQRLTGSIQELGRSLNMRIDENYREFVTFRVEVVEKLGALNTNLETIRGDIRTEVSEKLGSLNTNLETIRGDLREFQSTVVSVISVAKWGIGIAIPILISLVGFSFWIAFQAGRLDTRMSQLESRVGITAAGKK